MSVPVLIAGTLTVSQTSKRLAVRISRDHGGNAGCGTDTGATGFRCRLAYQCKLTACSPFCVYPRNNNRLEYYADWTTEAVV